MSYDEFLKAVVASLRATLSPGPEEGESTLVVTTDGGRKQEVRLEPFEADGRKYVRMVTTLGGGRGLSQRRLVSVLELNASLLYGALALYGEHLVLTDTLDLEVADADDGARVVRYLARMADTFEKMVYGLDRS